MFVFCCCCCCFAGHFRKEKKSTFLNFYTLNGSSFDKANWEKIQTGEMFELRRKRESEQSVQKKFDLYPCISLKIIIVF